MKTEIFTNYAAFLARDDKTINGVSPEFAEANPKWAEERGNEACWNCSGCSDCFRCSDCFDCSGCSCCSDCFRCSGCSRCSCCSDCLRCSDCFDCSDCSRCYDFSRCSGCSRCFDCSDCFRCYDCSCCSRCYDCFDCSRCYEKSGSKTNLLPVPKIEGIHKLVFAAVSQPHALDMSDWHTCDTTHCRAGWVVTLAGEAGKALESQTSTAFAAMQIYKASSPIRVSPTQFFTTNEKAMEDMARCAAEEAKLNQ